MLTASDLAGINPEDIQALLGSQQNSADLMSRNIKDVYARQDKYLDRSRADQQAVVKRSQEVEDAERTQNYKLAERDYIAAIESKDPLRIAQTSAQYANAKADMARAAATMDSIRTAEERQAELDAVKALTGQRKAESTRALADAGKKEGLTPKDIIERQKQSRAIKEYIFDNSNSDEGKVSMTQEFNNDMMGSTYIIPKEVKGIFSNSVEFTEVPRKYSPVLKRHLTIDEFRDALNQENANRNVKGLPPITIEQALGVK